MPVAGPIIGAVGALGGAAINANSQRGANRATKNQIKLVNQIYQNALLRTRALGAQGQAYQSRQLPLLQAAQKNALGVTSRIGTQATQDALQREQQQLGGAQQGLASRGLYNTTALESAQRGVHSDTSRALAEIQEATAGLQSGIIQQGGAQQAQSLGQSAQYSQGQAGIENQLAELIAGFQGGIQHTAGAPVDFSSLAKALSGLFGSNFAGGGGGGGFGTSIGMNFGNG